MRHRTKIRRLTQKPHHARLLQRNLVTSLFLYEAVRTTRARAKPIQPIVDRLITNAKKQDTHVEIRTLNAYVTDKNACRKVMEVLKPRYQSRPSGFTTLKAAGSRKGDGAELVDLALMDAVVGVSEEKTTKTKNTKKTTKVSTSTESKK